MKLDLKLYIVELFFHKEIHDLHRLDPAKNRAEINCRFSDQAKRGWENMAIVPELRTAHVNHLTRPALARAAPTSCEPVVQLLSMRSNQLS